MEVNKGESSMVKEVKAVITLRSGKEVDLPTSKLEHKLQNPPLTHECHFAAPPLISQLRNGLRKCSLAAKSHLGCENATWLRKWPLAVKSPLGFRMVAKWYAKLALGYEMGYEIPHWLRNHHFAAKWLKLQMPIAPAEETMPPKETTRIEVKVLIQPTQEATIDASAPQDPTIT
ncbi:hypothetical protein CK203_114478 [Vitis vinifera]|uniref:Uncharacterized protein n=1 Tax=Vitis vinifera TaxID=29760 RepID=A0A438CCW5_VITVI|nr:hypothetical protein CK203_114478 [Vitis vinifera]